MSNPYELPALNEWEPDYKISPATQAIPLAHSLSQTLFKIRDDVQRWGERHGYPWIMVSGEGRERELHIGKSVIRVMALEHLARIPDQDDVFLHEETGFRVRFADIQKADGTAQKPNIVSLDYTTFLDYGCVPDAGRGCQMAWLAGIVFHEVLHLCSRYGWGRTDEVDSILYKMLPEEVICNALSCAAHEYYRYANEPTPVLTNMHGDWGFYLIVCPSAARNGSLPAGYKHRAWRAHTAFKLLNRIYYRMIKQALGEHPSF